jgi:hypothetical protein
LIRLIFAAGLMAWVKRHAANRARLQHLTFSALGSGL